jgi:hypothetical protein
MKRIRVDEAICAFFVPIYKKQGNGKLLKRFGVPNQLRLNQEDSIFSDLQDVAPAAAMVHDVLLRFGLADEEPS